MENTKLEVLNKIKVIDVSWGDDGCEYVLCEDIEENRNKLLDAGFTKKQISESQGDGGGHIDLFYLAGHYSTSTHFSNVLGFVDLNSAKMPL